MNRLLDIDGPVMQFITKIAYCAWLNILWFLCCLPIVTVGASTTALFYVTLKIVKNEEGNITRAFFHSFKENFRQGTVIWLILLAVGIILGVDGYVFYHMRFDSVLWTLGTAVFLVLLAAYCIVLMYIFPLLARFDNTVPAMFKNALMIGMRFLFCTALMAAVYFAMAIIIVRFFTPAVVFGEGVCALLCSYLLSNILALCEEKSGSEETEGENSSEESKADDLEGFPVTENAEELSETGNEAFLEAAESNEPEWSVKDVRGTKAKLGYIWEYYKLPIVVACIILYIIGYFLHLQLTKKDVLLYLALVNMNTGEELTQELDDGFLTYVGANPKKEDLELYTGLYLTDDETNLNYEYVYASNTKITASIGAKQLDLVLMDQDGFDLLAQRGYLCNIEELLASEDPQLLESVRDELAVGTVILEDNSVDTALHPELEYTAVTDEYPMAVSLSQSPRIREAGFDGNVYLGVIPETERADTAVEYLRYLMGE